jgi:hypothetical protein
MESTTVFRASHPDETKFAAFQLHPAPTTYLGRSFGVDEYRCEPCGVTFQVPVPGFDADANDRERARMAEAHRRAGIAMHWPDVKSAEQRLGGLAIGGVALARGEGS